ncbi:MAG: ATP-binding protein [Candidatus Sericytochromatia bacterium]
MQQNIFKKINTIFDDLQHDILDENKINDFTGNIKKLISKFSAYKKELKENTLLLAEKEFNLKKSLDSVLNSTVDGIILVDNESREINIANEAFFKLCGYRAYEISGKDKTSAVSPENLLSKSLLRFIKYSFDIFTDSKNKVGTGTIEITHIKPNKILKATSLPLRNEKGDLDSIVINLKDITKEIQVEETQKKFFSSISHEFRTPIFSIIGYSELMSSEDMSIEDIKNYSSIINQESVRLASIIDNLLNALLADKEEFKVKLEKINVYQFLNQIIEEKAKITKSKGIIVNIIDNTKIIDIINSTESLSILFSNLISNMIKFSYKNSNATIEINKDNDNIIISFTNLGEGISNEFKDKIFEKFFRVESKIHTIEGAGLGLFIAKKISKIHGGDIYFESTINEKTTFYLKLPIKSKFDSSNFTSDDVYI